MPLTFNPRTPVLHFQIDYRAQIVEQHTHALIVLVEHTSKCGGSLGRVLTGRIVPQGRWWQSESGPPTPPGS